MKYPTQHEPQFLLHGGGMGGRKHRPKHRVCNTRREDVGGRGVRGTASWLHLLMCNRPFCGFCLTTVAQSPVLLKSRESFALWLPLFCAAMGVVVWQYESSVNGQLWQKNNSQTIPLLLLAWIAFSTLFVLSFPPVFPHKICFLQDKTRCGLKQ